MSNIDATAMLELHGLKEPNREIPFQRPPRLMRSDSFSLNVRRFD